eukprot:jgi/Botrbrau1/2489/Bobra.0226s0046.1
MSIILCFIALHLLRFGNAIHIYSCPTRGHYVISSGKRIRLRLLILYLMHSRPVKCVSGGDLAIFSYCFFFIFSIQIFVWLSVS